MANTDELELRRRQAAARARAARAQATAQSAQPREQFGPPAAPAPSAAPTPSPHPTMQPRPVLPQGYEQPPQPAPMGAATQDALAGRGMGWEQYVDATGQTGMSRPTGMAAEPANIGGMARDAVASVPERLQGNAIALGPVGMAVGQEDAGQVTKNFAESATLGVVGDEAFAAFDAAMGRGSYDERLQYHRDRQEQFREDHPMVSFASELAPALLPGLGGAKLVQTLSSKMGRTAAGGLLGALASGLYGGMEGEGGSGERVKQAVTTGALGALLGAAAPKVTDMLAAVPARVSTLFRRSVQRPTVQTLEATKSAAYDAIDNSGFRFDGNETQGLAQRVRDAFDAAEWVEDVDDQARAVMRTLDARAGQPLTIRQLDRIRQRVWDRYTGAKGQGYILEAVRAIDDLVDSKAGASALFDTARSANRVFRNAQLLEDAFRRAERQTAVSGSGGNTVNNMRRAVKNILNSSRQSRFFTDAEREFMDAFVQGSTAENFTRWIGKMGPGGNGLMGAGHMAMMFQTGGLSVLASAPLAGVKALSNRLARQGASGVQDVISGTASATRRAPVYSRGAAAVTTAGSPFLEEQAPSVRETLGQMLPSPR